MISVRGTDKTNKTIQNKENKEDLNKDFLQAPNLTEDMYRELSKATPPHVTRFC